MIYIALLSSPDYNSGPAAFKSAHKTLEGAKKSLYPDKDYPFDNHPIEDIWIGPDGFGMIRMVELQD